MRVNTQYKQINYGSILDNSPEVYCVLDINKKVYYFNEEWEKLTGINIADNDHSIYPQFFAEKDAQNFDRAFEKALKVKGAVKAEMRVKRGDIAFHTISYTLLSDGKSSVFLSGKIATSDKRLSRLRALIAEHTTLGAWKYDLTDGSLTWTIGTYAILEADGKTKVTPETLIDICHPDFVDALSDKYYRLIEQGEEFDIIVKVLKMRSGLEMWAKISGYAYIDESGNIERVYGIIQDIDEYKKAEIAITSEKKKAQVYLDIARVIILVIKPDQTVELINKAGCEILGYTEEELVGKNWFDAVVPNTIVDLIKASFHDFVSGTRDTDHSAYENPVLTKDGQIRYIAWKNTVLRDKFGQIVATISSGEDITERRKAERELKDSRERYALAIDGISAGVWDFYDIPNQKLYVSPKYLELLGRNYEERAYTLAELESWIDPAYLETVQAAFYKYLEDKKDSYNVEGKFIMGNGESRWFLFSGKAMWDKDGNPIRAVGSIVDINDRKEAEQQLQQQEEMLRAIINNGLMHSILLSSDGHIILTDEPVNQKAEEIYETRMKPGMHLSSFVQTGDYGVFEDKINKALIGHNVKFEYRFKDKGQDRYYLLSFSPIHNTSTGAIDKVLLNTLEITDTKRAELEMIRAKQLAEEVSRLKSNFLANMSHEIRTPLNGIIGLADLIETEGDMDMIREMAFLQKQSSNRLLNTLTGILNFAKLESEFEGMPLKKLNVMDVILNAYNNVKPYAEQKNLDVEIIGNRDDLCCMADDGLFYQVIHNLIHNAIKFTPVGKVIIEAGKKNKRIFIKITDTGIGIADDFIDKIFHPFLQESQGESRSYEGSGLGLSIAKRYINLLGGEITVSSKKGKGSSFEVWLPDAQN